jgi:Flp pilus assembly protein TadD
MDEAWVLVGETMDGAGDPASARYAYAQVQPGSPEYATAQDRLAVNLHNGGDKARALDIARAAAAKAPDDPQTLVVLADLLRDDERYGEAVDVLDKLIAKIGGDAATSWRLYYLRGAALEQAGKWPQAQGDLQQALKLKPDDPEILNYLGFAWADRGENLKQALTLLQKATLLDPQNGAVIDSLGWAHYRLGDYRQAVHELELAAALDAADPEVNDHLGDAYWRVGRRLEAKYQWRRVLSLSPGAVRRAAVETKLVDGLQMSPAPLAGNPSPGGSAPPTSQP